MNKKAIAAGVGAAVLAAVPTAMAFAQDFNPSGGTGGSAGSTGTSQGYNQGYDQGSNAGLISSGAQVHGANILFTKGGTTNVSQHTRSSVRGRNGNRAGHANGARGGNAVNRF